ncbi:MAG: radical SAM protein [Sarcina sp.]
MIEVAVFPCTYKCDGKCIMCTIYKRKTKDLSIETFKRIFSSEKLKKLKSINITGGEPTLRKDLCELVQMICFECKQIKEIIINTNGLNPNRISQKINEILKIIPTNIKLWVYVSVDSLTEKANYIRGVKNANNNTILTLKYLKEIQERNKNLYIGVSCTITSSNYDELQSIYDFALKENLFIDFIYATVNTAYINSISKKDEFMLNATQRKYVTEFLKEKYSNKNKIVSARTKIGNYESENIKKECILREGKGILIEADGKLRACGMTDKILLGDLSNKSESLENIGIDVTNKYKKYCEVCSSDSYYQWTREAQTEYINKILVNIKKMKKENK